MTRNERKRQRWFELGETAARMLSDGHVSGCYVCPLCSCGYTDVRAVRLEHAPPKSLGGKVVALTCVNCNTVTGSPLEADLKRFAQLVDLYDGNSQDWITAQFGVRGGTTTVNALARRVDSGTFEIVGNPKHNDPAATEIHNAEIEAMVDGAVSEQGWTISHPDHAYVPAKVAAALLKSAFIVAFARFGYRWAMQPALDPVRTQIADPLGSHIERFFLSFPGAPRDARYLLSVMRPRSMRCILVAIGRHWIFLPHCGRGSETLYDRLAGRRMWPPPPRSIRFTHFVEHEWPTSPTHVLDLRIPWSAREVRVDAPPALPR